MRTTKISIKNLLGIKELELDGKSIELSGANGVGKTSVIDAIRYALTNSCDREYIIKKGESEGEIIVETDTGIYIDRKVRAEKSDYKSIKQGGVEVGSPEKFLRDIFTQLQLSPVEFLSKSKNEQNAIILDMIEYEWNLDNIKEWFDEIPDWVNYEQNILSILNEIQSESGEYFKERQDTNRDIRNKRAFIDEIADSIPAGYQVDVWENADVGEVYSNIERIRKDNQTIEKALSLVENKNNKIRKFEADKAIAVAALDTEFSAEDNRISSDIRDLKEQIKLLEQTKAGLTDKKKAKSELIEQKYRADVAEFEAEVAEYKDYVGREIKSTTELEEKADQIEEMKSHINEYKRMVGLQHEINNLCTKAQDLTNKIEKARTLPGEILEKCKVPIDGLSVVNGIAEINGLPVSNLSEGEKLDLCIDVAIQKPNGLKIILIDGMEKLSTQMREKLYEKCQSKGLQFIATRTADDKELTITEF